MHPYLTGLVAETHRQDLLREADQHRLVRQARAVRADRTRPDSTTSLTQLVARALRLARPTAEPAAAVGRAPQQPVCCPA